MYILLKGNLINNEKHIIYERNIILGDGYVTDSQFILSFQEDLYLTENSVVAKISVESIKKC